MNPENPFQPQQQPAQPAQLNQPYTLPGPTPPPAPHPGYTPIQPANLPPTQKKPSKVPLIIAIVAIVLALAGIGVAIWAYMNYLDQKNNVDAKVTQAVADATKKQADKLTEDFEKAQELPNTLFAGPEDYGRVAFKYPKTWSVFVAKDASTGGTYEAYFNPGTIPPISPTQQYALHVLIEDKDYDKVIQSYQSLVTKGDLTSSPVKADEQNGTRLDGAFTKDIHGSAVIFKIRDKTVTIRTDAEVFKDKFNDLIQTITFNK